MNNYDIEKIFEESLLPESFHRVDENHILDIYVGKDQSSRNTMFLISESKPMNLLSSELINVLVGKRKDNKWTLSFILTDNKFKDIFYDFCTDIIESSRVLQHKAEGMYFICKRYICWQKLFKKRKNSLLSESQIKGLIGELLFLRDHMLKLYDVEIATKSWMGPLGVAQDFIIENTWYEIKSINKSAKLVEISSIEQLDTEHDGELIIYRLDRVNQFTDGCIDLNGLVKEVKNIITNSMISELFEDRLLEIGYVPKVEYEKYVYKCTSIETYIVCTNFPRLRRNSIPLGVANAKYNILISSLNNFKKKG